MRSPTTSRRGSYALLGCWGACLALVLGWGAVADARGGGRGGGTCGGRSGGGGGGVAARGWGGYGGGGSRRGWGASSGSWAGPRYDPYDPVPVRIDPRFLALPDESPERRAAAGDEWVRGAAAWVRQSTVEEDCFARLAWVAAEGGYFLADQVASLIALCGDGAEPMLRATAILGPRIVDPHNAALRIVALFPLSDDKRRARALLPRTSPLPVQVVATPPAAPPTDSE